MFETLPQHPQHPQPFQQLFQQSPRLCTSSWMPASPSPLGPCNKVNVPRTAGFSSKMGANTNANHAATGTGKENSTSSNIIPEKNNNNNNNNAEKRGIFSFTNTPASSSSPRQSTTYEQRFKSSTSRARLFGFPSSADSNSSASARANKQRALFLNKVKQDRDDSRFHARGESVMMMEHLSEQRDWREDMRRRADAVFEQYRLQDGEWVEEEEEESKDMGMDDSEQYALEMQEQEMDALLENMPSPAKSVRSFCCDDDDTELEDLFDQFVGGQSQDMDMSG